LAEGEEEKKVKALRRLMAVTGGSNPISLFLIFITGPHIKNKGIVVNGPV
jgi:hypothetical protein